MITAKELRRLPDGKTTQSLAIYLKKWKAIYQPIEEAYGLRLIGFDPGLLFADADHPQSAIDIPLWLAKRMVEVAREGR